MRKVCLLLALIVISGCICQGGDMDVAKELGFCSEKEVISPDEMLAITDSKVTPETVFPGGQVRLNVFLQNIDPKEDLKDVKADLYDYWIMTLVESPDMNEVIYGCTGTPNCDKSKDACLAMEGSSYALCEYKEEVCIGSFDCHQLNNDPNYCEDEHVAKLCKYENGECVQRFPESSCTNLGENDCLDSFVSSVGCRWGEGCLATGVGCNEMPEISCKDGCSWGVIKKALGVPDIPPGGTRKVEWTLTAPSTDQIANIKSEVKLKYRFLFKYDGRTTRELTVMTENEYYAILNSGTDFPIMGQTKLGGPVKADVGIGTERPLIAGNSFPVYLTVENVGKGFVTDGVVPSNELTITFPGKFVNSISSEDFRCENVDGNYECKNNEDMRFFEDSTDRYVFNLVLEPENYIGFEGRPYLTENIVVEFSCDYELRGEEEVTVQPYD